MAQFFYDRANLYVDGIRYAPSGQLRGVNCGVNYNNKQQNGFNDTPNPVGITIGNWESTTLEWTEYLPPATAYINWNQRLISNPNTQMILIPVTLALGQPKAGQQTITGIYCKSIMESVELDGVFVRKCSFGFIVASSL